MKLDYNKFNVWGVDFETRRKGEAQFIIDEIKKRQIRLQTKQAQINDLTYESNLITQNICDVIKEDLSLSSCNLFYGLVSEVFWEAWRYFHNHDKKDFEAYKDEKVKENEKGALTLINAYLVRNFFDDDKKAKLNNISMCGYNETGYDFTYQYKGEEIQIFVPLFEKVDEKNYLEMLNGYQIRFKESESCWGFIAGGLDYTELAKKLKTWLNKRRKERKNETH